MVLKTNLFIRVPLLNTASPSLAIEFDYFIGRGDNRIVLRAAGSQRRVRHGRQLLLEGSRIHLDEIAQTADAQARVQR